MRRFKSFRTRSCFLLQPKVLGWVFLSLLDAKNKVQEPVKLHGPSFVSANFNLIKEVLFSILLVFPHCQGIPDVLDIFFAG